MLMQSHPGALTTSGMQEFLAETPRQARSFYYRDDIGNISTSSLRYTPTAVRLCLSMPSTNFPSCDFRHALTHDTLSRKSSTPHSQR